MGDSIYLGMQQGVEGRSGINGLVRGQINDQGERERNRELNYSRGSRKMKGARSCRIR